MYVKKRKNKSGSTSIQIIKKSGKSTKLVETIGCSDDEAEIEELVKLGTKRIVELQSDNQLEFSFPTKCATDEVLKSFLSQEGSISVSSIGPELILGKIFRDMGFSKISEPLFEELVLGRLVYPVSKLGTSEYLLRHKGEVVEVSKIYRFLDRLHSKHKEEVEQIVFDHTQKVVGPLVAVFYDITTLYFEAEKEDDLRRIGFSKDGKFNKPQISLGLLVGPNGYPVAYDIFEGNKFEGHTLIPFIERSIKKFNLSKPTIIADSGLLSKANIAALEAKDYTYILGARIKNESELLKSKVIEAGKSLADGETTTIERTATQKLILQYSQKRAKKDAYNRDRGIQRLKKQIKAGRLNKQHINNRGYNKFLSVSGSLSVAIDLDKISHDHSWDGLKGYVTNSDLSPEQVISNYSQLWHIEKAFRISKTDLRIRPIYHRKKRRIEAHICIAFVAYAIYKEFERLLKEKQINISVTKAIEHLKSINQISCILPESKERFETFAQLNNIQNKLLEKLA